MIVGLIIILVFPFIYFYTQMNNFNQKTDAIRTAINEKKETYIDPLTGKMHWTENGEQVIWTEILSVERNIPEGCIIGDKVLRGVKTGRVYRNKSYEDFKDHIQEQILADEVWCYERNDYAKANDSPGKTFLRYHMKDKYFYSLKKEEKKCIVEKSETEKDPHRSWDKYKVITEKKYYIIKNKKTTEISFEEYKRLGGK